MEEAQPNQSIAADPGDLRGVLAVASENGLPKTDCYLLSEWEGSLLSARWAPASARRATNRLRAFASATRAGLLFASKQDVIAFAQRRAEALGTDLMGLLRNEGWRQDVRTIRSFFRWTRDRKILGVATDPTVGLRWVPGHPPGVRLQPGDARLYEAVLNAPGLGDRDRLIVLLLGHGLHPKGVAVLRIDDVVEGKRLNIGRGSQSRMLPLSDRVILALGRWLRVRDVPSLFLFPAPEGKKSLSASAVRAVVRRAAQLAFPRPDQHGLRAKVHATGFRHLFLFRAIRARVALASVRQLTGADRLAGLERYIKGPRLRLDVHREITRMSKRWPNWI